MDLPDFNDFDANRKLFFDSFEGLKTIQTLPDDKKKKPPFNITKIVNLPGGVYPDSEIPKGFLYDRSKWIPFNYIKRLEQFNDAGACVSLTINETNGNGRKQKDIIKVRALFADFDEVPLPDKWLLEPSFIVETSKNKYHAYWLVDDFPIEMFRQTQDAIAYNLKTDVAMKDIARALRIPGFYHRKKEPFLSRIIAYSGLKYTVSDFNVFKPRPVKQWSSSKYNTIKNNPDKKFLGTYGTSRGGRNNHIAKRIGGMLKRGLSWGEIETEAMKEAIACTPPLSEQETLSILESMRRY